MPDAGRSLIAASAGRNPVPAVAQMGTQRKEFMSMGPLKLDDDQAHPPAVRESLCLFASAPVDVAASPWQGPQQY